MQEMQARVSSSQAIRTVMSGGLTVLCLAVLWLALDVTRSQAVAPQAMEQPVRIGTTDILVSLDPADAYDNHSWEVLQNIGTGLLMGLPGTTELAPSLAVAMPEVSPDGLMYTVTLRSGLQFPDGTAFDAYAVKWSIDRVASLAGGPSWLVTEFVSQTEIADSTTVRFVLKEPSNVFPTLLALPTYFPVSPNCFPAGDFDRTSTCGGIGPYRIATWTQGTSLELEAYAGYHGSPPESSSIVLHYFDNAAGLRQALEEGNIDVAWKSLTPEDYEELRADLRFNSVPGGSGYIRYLCFNTTTAPFDGAGIRTALAAAVDREASAQQVYLNTMSPLYSMVPNGMWSHRDSYLDLYGRRNLTETRTLLQQAGYSASNKLQMDLWYALEHYGPAEPDLAAALAADIEESGVVLVTVRGTDWSTFRDQMAAGSMPVFLLGWYPDFLDPDNYTWTFAHSSSSDGLGIFYDNPVMDGLLEAGRAATPVQGAAREAIYVDIQELWAEEAPTVPLLEGTQIAVARDWMRDVVISPGGTLIYSTMWRDTSAETIGPGGGSLASYNGDTVLEFPAGALTSTVVMTYTPASTAPPGNGLASIGRSYDLSAVFLGTGQPARLAPGYTYSVTVHYSAADVSAVDENRLALFSWDGGQWLKEPSSRVHPTERTVTATPEHFSLWAVLAETRLRVATSADYPPMEYISGTQIVGHDIDLMDALAAEMSVTVGYNNTPWDDLLVGLGERANDVVISSVSVTPKREEAVDFTLPYVTFNYGGPDDNIGIAVQQGNGPLRRQMNEALWELRSDGTLATIIAGIAADEPTWNARLPDWPLVDPGTGATLVYTDTEGTTTTIQVPGGAVTETALLDYTPLNWASPPSGLSFANHAFDLDAYRDGGYVPSGLALAVPATITVRYRDTDVAGFDEASLVLERRNTSTGAWEDAACGPYERHPAENRLAVPVCHLSRFALFGEFTGLMVATSADYPPMEYISGTQIIGHDIDLMDALAAEIGVTVVYTNVAWDNVLVGLEAGAYDASISTLTVTPGRERALDFTLPYVTLYFEGADDDIGIAVQQGDSELRRQMNEALWVLRGDGTLAAIIAGIATDKPTWNPRLPIWPSADPGTEATLVYSDTQGTSTSIQVPVDALTETVLLVYTPIDATAPPSGYAFADRSFDLDAYRDGVHLSEGLALSVPVTVTLQYIDAEIAGLNEGALLLERWNEDASLWEDAACGPYDRHPYENWLAVPVCHLSRFALIGKYTVYLPLVSRQQ